MMDLSKALRSSTVGVLVSAIGADRYQSSFTSPVYSLQLGLGLRFKGLGFGLWGLVHWVIGLLGYWVRVRVRA